MKTDALTHMKRNNTRGKPEPVKPEVVNHSRIKNGAVKIRPMRGIVRYLI
jgi:hypothetical protein